MPPRETLEWYPGCLETPHGKGRGLLQAPFNSWDGSAGAAFRSSASFPAGMPLLLAWDAKHLPKGYKEPSLPCATLQGLVWDGRRMLSRNEELLCSPPEDDFSQDRSHESSHITREETGISPAGLDGAFSSQAPWGSGDAS